MEINGSQVNLEQLPALLESLLAGQTLGPLLGHSLQSQETFYYIAHTFYGQGKYADAMKMFGFLVLCDHLDRRYYAGLAGCLQMQNRHRDAIKHWQMAAVLELTDPAPSMHIAECHMHLGDREQARVPLEFALAQARAQEQYRGHIPRLEALLKLLGPAQDAGAGPQPSGSPNPTERNPSP